MAVLINEILPYTAAGGLVGLLVGLTGVGGGSLMTPLLTILFGFTPSVAVGTDLAFAAITKGVGTLAHRLHGNVRWDIVRFLALGSLPAAVITIGVLKIYGELDASWQHTIRVSIGVSVLLTALSLLFRQRLLDWMAAHPERQLTGRNQRLATVLVGVVIGILVTISSIGAGAIGATLIVLLYPTLRTAEVAGTDIAYAVPLTALAGLGHWWLGNVHVGLLIGLLLGSMPAIWLGARLASALPERYVRAVLATTLTLVGFKLIA